MSLQDELLELNAVYQSVQEKNEALRQENEALREMVRGYAKWVAPMETTVKSGERIPESWWEAKRDLQERAQGMLLRKEHKS